MACAAVASATFSKGWSSGGGNSGWSSGGGGYGGSSYGGSSGGGGGWPQKSGWSSGGGKNLKIYLKYLQVVNNFVTNMIRIQKSHCLKDTKKKNLGIAS